MRGVKFGDVQEGEFGLRGGTGSAGIKTLIDGQPDDPDNFGLYLQELDKEFFTPRHRHNFDQFRIALESPYNIGPKLDLEPGEMAYFPEGAYYGPQHGVPGTVVLSLHVAGASRSGYINIGELIPGLRALKERGTVENGIYTEIDADGKKHNKDSYEAVWEYLRGRKLEYPRPRYSAPVKIEPDNFDWLFCSEGVRTKRLGSFTEYRTALNLFELAPNAGASFGLPDQRCLMVVKDGSIDCEGGSYGRFSAILIERGENCRVQAATQGAGLFEFVLPNFNH